jgi:hypothetical protein
MALEFRPPTDLVDAYLKRPSPGEQVSAGIQQAMQLYAQQKALEQQQGVKTQEANLLAQKEAREGRQQFYDYGDVGGLPKDVQASIGQPAQGPAYPVNVPLPNGVQGPENQQMVQPALPNMIERYNKFLEANPAGLKGGERKMNQDLQASEVAKNNAQAEMYGRSKLPGQGPQSKPQLRMNQFTGEYEWYLPPTGGSTPGASPQVLPGGAPAATAHGPGTFHDVSKAAGTYAEDQAAVNGVLSELSRVKDLNKNSRGGVLGSGLQKIQSAANIGTNSPEFKNTADVVNTLKAQVSRVLKSTFGGQLSDSERAYLNDVYGASERMSPQERDIAIKNVQTMLTNKAQTSGAKFNALSGTAPLNPAQTSVPQGGPAVGTIEDGHRFKGGNPADPSSWEAV